MLSLTPFSVPFDLVVGRAEELASVIVKLGINTPSTTVGILSGMSGCKELWFTADCGTSTDEATEGRGEARMILVNEIGLNGLELTLLSATFTNIYVWSFLGSRSGCHRLLCQVKLFLTHKAVLRSLLVSAQWVQKTVSFHLTRESPSFPRYFSHTRLFYSI